MDDVVIGELTRDQRTVDGYRSLSPRELEILDAMARGLSNHAIASQLFLSPRTVESHVRAILVKLMLLPEDTANRRVCAVLMHLRQRAHRSPSSFT